MKKISSIIQHFKSNPLTRLEKQLLVVLILTCSSLIIGEFYFNTQRSILHKEVTNWNKAKIKQSEKIIFEQQKEIEKLKKDVVLHTILADSSIAKANRLSKKQINNEVAFSKIDSMVASYDANEIELFWLNRKSK